MKRLWKWGGAALLTFVTGVQAQEPLGVRPGTTWEYRLEGGTEGRPKEAVEKGTIVDSAAFRAGPVVRIDDRNFQWFEIAFTRVNGQSYSAWVLLDQWPQADRAPAVARYLWSEPGWETPVEFVNALTGQAELPRKNLWRYGWPQDAESGGPASFLKAPPSIFLHGWPFERTQTRQTPVNVPADNVHRVALNPEVMIAATGVHLDELGRHEDFTGRKYRYIEDRDEEDWRKDIAAGINLLVCDGQIKVPDWIWRTHCYVAEVYLLPHGWPAQLYRSNYYGRAIYVDEPCIRIRGQLQADAENGSSATKLTPEGAARLLRSQISKQLTEEGGNYNLSALESWVDKVFGKGNLDLVEDHVAAIEAIWQSAWYQLSVKEISAFWDEWFFPEQLVHRYNMAFGTQIPATVENSCAFYTAIVRGAARNFEKSWGSWLYLPTGNQVDPLVYTSAFRYLYDAGATFFGHWYGWPGIGDDGYSSVPYPYRRANAANLRQIAREHPRRDLHALLRAAEVCVTIPDGYTLSPGPMYGIKALHLERKNPEGVTYRKVLSNAAQEIERLIRAGIPFDVAVNSPDFRPDGYREVIQCREDGTVAVAKPGEAEQIFASARDVERPDLGPAWEIGIETVEIPTATPGWVRLKSVIKEGTGELVKAPYHYGTKFIHWEVIDPLGFSSFNLSQNGKESTQVFEGEECKFEAKEAGDYRVRVAMVDNFGRPAIHETTLRIGPAPAGVGALSSSQP